MKKSVKGIIFYAAIFAVLIMTLMFLYNLQGSKTETITYSQLMGDFRENKIKTFVLDNYTLNFSRTDGTYGSYVVAYPWMFYEDLAKTQDAIVADGKTPALELYDYIPPAETPWWVSMIPYVIMIVIFVVMWFFLMNQAGGGGNKAMSFGKAKTRIVADDKKKITFADVAGADEEKEELSEIVDFLRDPRKFAEIGARIPKGVLMVGPPGTGKTYIAKAVSGEAGVPFLSISGSDFVEMFVGVGASRVRDLFEQAKKNAPAIIFIDEIDAVGRQRGAGLGGGHDEREQTLNQLLVEMDGFSPNEGVIIIAATNRPDILDSALLRPGRFDRQVYVGLPDIKAREAILEIHSRKKPLSPEVDLAVVAKGTGGFSPADLENLLNEAALLAARRKKHAIEPSELQEAMIKVVVGPEKRSRIVPETEKRITAYHEAGHAIATRFCPSHDPVHEISIIPRGRAGGYTMSLPTEDKNYASRLQMQEDIVVLLGGRVAEKLTLDDISTGASSDIMRSTDIARKMVTKYGMSDKLGPIVFGSEHDEVFLGRDFGTAHNYSEEIASQIDSEIKAIVDGAYEKCERILSDHKDKLVAVAEYLLENEKMDGAHFEELFTGKRIEKTASEVLATPPDSATTEASTEPPPSNDADLNTPDDIASGDDKSI